ncbi:MAG: hypothetical protein ACYTHJ_09525 [Planctomycetota bacterium]|jgi:hypothetical protein
MEPKHRIVNTIMAENEVTTASTNVRKGRLLAYAGLVQVIAGPIVYYSFQDHHLLRSTGILAWLLMGDGILMAVVGAATSRTRSARIIAGCCVTLTALFALMFFPFSRLPQATDTKALTSAPDVTLANHEGQPVTLSALWKQGPLLLVFYRGHW